MLWKVDGLSEYDIRRPLTPTGTNLLGLVKHLADCEIGYFGDTFGRALADPPPLDAGRSPRLHRAVAVAQVRLEQVATSISGLWRCPANAPRGGRRAMASWLGGGAAVGVSARRRSQSRAGYSLASVPASKVRISPTVRSWLVGSGSGRCAWIW